MKTKHFFLITAGLLSFTLAFAQTEKGNMLIGGTAGFDIQFEKPDNFISADLSPELGFFLAKNLAVGAALSVGVSKVGEISSTAFGIAPFGRYYFGTGMTRIFAHAQFGFVTYDSKFGSDNNSSSNATAIMAGPGVAFFLSKHVAIEGVLAYSQGFGDIDAKNLGLRFGVQAYMGGE